MPRKSQPDIPSVPEAVVVAPDYLNEVQKKWDVFFDEVLTYLGYESPEARKAFVDIESYVLNREDPTQIGKVVEGSEAEPLPTDNRILLLKVQNRVVASVFEWRDDFNFVQVSPALHLNEEMTEQIRFDLRPIE